MRPGLVFAAALAMAACAQTEPAARGADAGVKPPAMDASQGDGGVPPFYVADAIPAKPGVLLRKGALPPELILENAGDAARILYSSTDGLDGKTPVAVSGAVFLPKGSPPAGGWPLLAWAHGTVGVADICAPSFAGRSQRDVRYLNHWLAQGYAVVASDYQGLGTPGGHPYLATKPAAYSMLDSIRAVQAGAFPVSRKVVLIGQSQGGGAAFGTAGIAGDYAPELDIRGTVATGTPYFTPSTPPAVRDPNEVSPVFGYTLLILYLKRQLDPTFRIEDYANANVLPAYQLGATACFGQVARAVVDNKLTVANSFRIDPTPEIAKHYPLMSYTTLKVKGPVFMGTGGVDLDVPPAGQARLARDACAAGSTILHKVYPELDHSGAVNGSLADSTPFVKAAFAGEKIQGNCGG